MAAEKQCEHTEMHAARGWASRSASSSGASTSPAAPCICHATNHENHGEKGRGCEPESQTPPGPTFPECLALTVLLAHGDNNNVTSWITGSHPSQDGYRLVPGDHYGEARAMTDLLDDVDTYGSTCWVPLCEWDSAERFTRVEAVRDYDDHASRHREAKADESAMSGRFALLLVAECSDTYPQRDESDQPEPNAEAVHKGVAEPTGRDEHEQEQRTDEEIPVNLHARQYTPGRNSMHPSPDGDVEIRSRPYRAVA